MDWGLAFSHPNWTLAQGQKFPIVLGFDGRNTFNVDGVMMSSNAVLVAMPDNSGLIKSFRAAKTMSAFAQGTLFQFNLDGTSILLPALVSCVKTITWGGLAAATDFTAPLIAAKTAKQAAPPTAASSLQPGIPQEGSAEYQLEAMQIASNFILKASLVRLRYSADPKPLFRSPPRGPRGEPTMRPDLSGSSRRDPIYRASRLHQRSSAMMQRIAKASSHRRAIASLSTARSSFAACPRVRTANGRSSPSTLSSRERRAVLSCSPC